ncbi:MAG: type VI secretion system lipoprotein TssJ [Gammaproteobacteria bacterium]|nr:type VI secretion system lipoprotein TssJ [Gammaproteobacteria bacterium]
MFKKSLIVGAIFLLCGCSSLDTKISASSDINPDLNGNPSPISVSVFELSDSRAFIAADFIHLYTEAPTTLGSSLLAERNLMLVPGTTEAVSLPFVKGVTAIAYVAAYQNLTNTNWREIVSVTPNRVQGSEITLTLNNQGISLVSDQKTLSLWNNL